jgi:hypothetical protein
MMSFLAETAPVFSEPLPEGRLRRPGEALAVLIERYRSFELGTAVERARIFPHLVGEQQRNPQLNATVRAGIARARRGFEALARAARERRDVDATLEPHEVGILAVSLLQGLLIQLSVYGEELDIDAYSRAAVSMIDRPPPV